VHVRLNIPVWGARELAWGALALTRPRGGFVERLRRDIAEEVGDRHVVLLASARHGLAISVRALGLRRVAVPAYVCPAVLTGLRAGGAGPVPVDCDESSFRFDSDALRRAVDEGRVDGILAPNTYGHDQDFAALSTLGRPVIDDAAYQAGRRDRETDRACGTRGDAGVWSFNFKALTGVGGGVLFVRTLEGLALDPARRRRADVLPFLNLAARSVIGYRLPAFLPGASAPSPSLEQAPRAPWMRLDAGAMSEVQAAVALAQWRTRSRLETIQRANAATIARVVGGLDVFALLSRDTPEVAVHFLPLLVRVESDAATSAVYQTRRILHAHGVQTERAYPLVLGAGDTFPRAHDLARRLVLVPCSAALDRATVARIGAALTLSARELERSIRPVDVSSG
jgi:dTDP-4-amino-4,6-dideoxygalactose transaminase